MEIVIVVIRNSQQKYFIHQRRSDKKSSPNLFALGIGGRVEAGETINVAAKRELKEEAGIVQPIKFLFSMDMKNIGLDESVHIYEIIFNGAIETCLDEWQWSGWITENELDKLIEDDKLCPDDAEFYKKYKKLNGSTICL